MGKAGIRLKRKRPMFTVTRKVSKPAPVEISPSRSVVIIAIPAMARMEKATPAMTKFTNGPATVIQNSCLGSSGIRSKLATPPIGSKVMSRVFTPKRWAVRAWPNSCRTTQPKTIRIRPISFRI